MSRVVRRWRSLLLAGMYTWFAWDIASSPFQPWFARETWQIMYWVAAVMLFWQWLRPSVRVFHVAMLMFPSVGILRGLAVWEEFGATQGFTNSAVVLILWTVVYPAWRSRFDG